MTETNTDKVGAVVIGRNEGERLKRCLRSLVGQVDSIVYVDSGSTDGSVEFARSLAVDVVELNLDRPFTMARARNAGFRRLEELIPEVNYVQFVDGDCEVVDGWLPAAAAALDLNVDVGSVGGDRFEVAPDATIFNRLTDMEWRGIPGEAITLGGDVMMRAQAFRDVNGYQDQMIAGEDPEICLRLRTRGWRLLRLDHAMTRHDVSISRLSQWWKRAIRTGHSYAERAYLHPSSTEPRYRLYVIRNWFWGLFVPCVAVAGAFFSSGYTLLMLGLYPIWIWRVARFRQKIFGDKPRHAWIYGFFCMMEKGPHALGQLLFVWRRLQRRPQMLIEYKVSAPEPKA